MQHLRKLSFIFFVSFFFSLGSAYALPEKAELTQNDCPTEALGAVNAICYTAVVPEDHDQPSGTKISFPVAVLKGERDDSPLFYFPGGPGGTVLNADSFLERLKEGAGGRDLVVFAYRGGRYATPELDCDPSYQSLGAYWTAFSPVVNSNKSPEKRFSYLTDYFETCHAHLQKQGFDIAQYTEYRFAFDIDAVRQALGYEKIHVAGHSAGGSSVFTQARYFPAAVKSVIAEAPWPTWTRNRWPLDEYYASRTAYAQLLSPYVGQVLNGHEFSLLDIDRAQKVLDKKPYTFKWNGKTAQFDGAALMHRLYVDFPDDPKPLAAFLAAIANGDRSGLKAFVGEPKEAVIEQGDFPWGLHLASVCGDIGEAKLTKYEALALVKAEPGLLGFESILACPWWSTIGDVPVEHSRPPSLDIPVLVITGEYDTCCGRRIVDEIRPVSPVVQAVDLPGRGHGVMGDCRNEAVRQFLDNPTAPVDVSCLSEE